MSNREEELRQLQYDNRELRGKVKHYKEVTTALENELSSLKVQCNHYRNALIELGVEV